MTQRVTRCGLPRRIVTHHGFSSLVSLLLFAWLLATSASSAPSAHHAGHNLPQQPLRPLTPEQGYATELAAGEIHSCQLTLVAGHYLNVLIDQRGVNVVMTLFAPDGTKLTETDMPDSAVGWKSLLWETQTSGHYRLEVRGRDNTAAGRYAISMEKLLALTEKNRPLIAADRATAEGYRLHQIGTAEALRGAIGKFIAAVPHWRTVGESRREAETLTFLGESYYHLNHYQQALDIYEQALPVWRAIAHHNGEAWALGNVAAAWNALGEKQKALAYYEQSIRAYQAAGNQVLPAHALTGMSGIYASLGEKQKALAALRQALSLWQGVYDAGREARAIYRLGEVYALFGEREQALKHYQQALAAWRKNSDPKNEGLALHSLGRLYATAGDVSQALQYFTQALRLRQVTGDREGEAATLYEFARIERDQNHLDEARGNIEDALQRIEQVRTNIVSQELRASYFATVREYYEFYLELLMRLHERRPTEGFDARALYVSERNRARSLLEILTKAGVELRSGADAQWPERQQQVNGKAASPRYAALTQPQPLSAREIQQQILDQDTMLLEYALGEERSWLWAVTPETITSYELPKRDEIEAAARRVYDLLTARNARRSAETAAQRRVRVTEAEKDYPQAAADLSRMLLAPVAAHLGRKRLLIVTEGALQFIPFAALPALSVQKQQAATNRRSNTPFRPLVAEHEIITLPSASTLAVLRRETAGRTPAPKTLVVLADPVFSAEDERVRTNTPAHGKPYEQSVPSPRREVLREVTRALADLSGTDASPRLARLSGTRWEAEQILSHVAPGAGMKAFDFAASRATAINPALSRYRILHFATHALINNQHPELSGIVLSLVDEQGQPQDGFLRAHEIYNLKLPAELVVLSGCQTGLGKEVRGEGLVGLTRGFMYAGAARVLVSLWSLDDRATAELMKQFYARMLGRERLSPAAALRAAQMAMWKSRQWQPPYYWAAFTLQGEWK